jgi:large subunit ribosomal protein L1
VKFYLFVADGIEFVKKNSRNTFDATIELHINFALDVKKADQIIRFSTTLPNGTGKTKRVAVLASKKVANADLELAEADIEKLEKSQIKPKVDFDVLIAEPRYMAKLAKAARVLGPAGVMPNPKNGTVAEDVEKAVELVKKGKVEIRTEQNFPIAHTILGKKSFTTEALVENFEEIMNSIKNVKPAKAKPGWIETAFLTSTMGKSARVDITKYSQ